MDLVHELKGLLQPITQPTPLEIKQVLKGIGCTHDRIAPYLSEPDPQSSLPYGRKVILRTDLFEVIVINIPGKTETPVHDHGHSIGCVYVVFGGFINRLYKVGEHSKEPVLQTETRYGQGECLLIDDGLIHSMGNPVQKNMVSLHVYSPPIHDNKLYSSSTGSSPLQISRRNSGNLSSIWAGEKGP
ncbi:cysteine dioxygenase [Salinithrix halophila]|uniref:Cysteine dioxygenase n=1 Tax=Salinithrix halophila TaxID=1485204 RepID=A0ABV8JGF7_9BACL